MVTHSSTSRPVQCLCMAERTECLDLTPHQLRRWYAPTHPHVIQEDGFREGSSRLTPGR
jgi:hypothetical protein